MKTLWTICTLSFMASAGFAAVDCKNSLAKTSGIVDTLSAQYEGEADKARLYNAYYAPGKILSSPGFRWAIGEGFYQKGKNQIPSAALHLTPQERKDLATGNRFTKAIEKSPASAAEDLWQIVESQFDTSFLERPITATTKEGRQQESDERLQELSRRQKETGLTQKQFVDMVNQVKEIRDNPKKKAELLALLEKTLPEYADAVLHNEDVANTNRQYGASFKTLFPYVYGGFAATWGGFLGATMGVDPVLATGASLSAAAAIPGAMYLYGLAKAKLTSMYKEAAFRSKWNGKKNGDLADIAKKFGISEEALAEAQKRQSYEPYTPVAHAIKVKPVDIEKGTETSMSMHGEEVRDVIITFGEALAGRLGQESEASRWESVAEATGELVKRFERKKTVTKADAAKLLNPVFSKHISNTITTLEDLEHLSAEANEISRKLTESIQLAMVAASDLQTKLEAENLGESERETLQNKLIAISQRAQELERDKTNFGITQVSLGQMKKGIQGPNGFLRDTQNLILLDAANLSQPNLSEDAIGKIVQLYTVASGLKSGTQKTPSLLITSEPTTQEQTETNEQTRERSQN